MFARIPFTSVQSTIGFLYLHFVIWILRLINSMIELIDFMYTHHALRPYIDSEINHIRHFIKIQFVNKGIEFINLPSKFKDKSVISSIPTYFENKESPIICYKYNKPIRSTVLTITN